MKNNHYKSKTYCHEFPVGVWPRQEPKINRALLGSRPTDFFPVFYSFLALLVALTLTLQCFRVAPVIEVRPQTFATKKWMEIANLFEVHIIRINGSRYIPLARNFGFVFPRIFLVLQWLSDLCAVVCIRSPKFACVVYNFRYNRFCSNEKKKAQELMNDS